MHRSISRTVRTVIAAAAATAVVAIAGPAHAITTHPTLYVDGFGTGGNHACIGGSVDIDGYNLPSKSKYADVTEVSALLVIKTVTVSGGDFVATIDSNGEKGRVPYHVYAYNKNGKRTFEGSVTIKWVRCNIVY